MYAILRVHYFSKISDGCKFCTIEDRFSYLVSDSAQLLVCCSAHRKEHFSVHCDWSGNAMKTTKEHILDYNIYNNRNPSVSSSFLFLASNICNFYELSIFQRFQMAVNFVPLKIGTSNF